MVSPNNKSAMLKHLQEWNNLWVKTFFDPGQMILAFSKEELQNWASNANYLIVNENEYKSYLKTSWLDELELLDNF